MFGYTAFSFAVWIFVLGGIIFQILALRRRADRGEMLLDEYRSPQPLEWLFTLLLVLAAAALVMGAITLQGGNQFHTTDQVYLTQLITAGALVFLLIYFGVRGKIWFSNVKQEFIRRPKATTQRDGRVVVNLEREFEYQSPILRRGVWAIYGLGCLLAVLPLLSYIYMMPPLAVPVVLIMIAGAAVVWSVVIDLAED